MPERPRRGRGGDSPTPPEKTCDACGRRITWRASMARSWDDVRWCSDACRRHGYPPADRELDERLLAALERHPRRARVALDDLASAAGADAGREELRSAARRLAARGLLEILQRGVVVDPSTARGPLSVRRA